jgi:hypothetical protein
MEDYGKMTSYTTGFNHQWSAIGDAEHMSPEEFDAAATEFLENNWMTYRELLEMNWPKTLELIDTAEVDVIAFTDAFVRPVNDFLLNVFWTVEEYYEIACWIIGWETLEVAWSVEYTMEYALVTVSNLIWDFMYIIMDLVYSIEMVGIYSAWTTYDILSWAFDGVLTIDDILYSGLMNIFAYAGYVCMDWIWYGVYLGWDLYFTLDNSVRWTLSMLFDCEEWEVYEVGFDVAGLHVPYWDLLALFFIM